MALDVEGVVGSGVEGQKSLGRPHTLESLHLALPPSGRLMRIFRSVVAPPPALMAMGDPKITSGRTLRSKVIGHNLVRNKANFLEQFPHQFQCSSLVPLALHENVEDFALSIDGTPQVDQPAIDFDEYLVKMPSGMRLGPASSKVSCDHGTEVIHPATHRFIGSDDPALSQQILDIAKLRLNRA